MKSKKRKTKSFVEELEREKRSTTHWHSLENILYAIERISGELGHFPTQGELRQYGHGINSAISTKHGGLIEIRRQAGYGAPEVKPAGYWQDWKNAEKELKNAIRDNGGEFPSQKWLGNHGLGSLACAIANYYGGFRKVREKMGFEIIHQDPELLKDFNWISKQLKQITKDDHGEFPTNPRLKELERYDLTWAIYKYHGGINSVREKMGYKPVQSSPRAFAEWKVVSRELKEVIKENDGEFPSEGHLRKIGRGDIAHAVNKHHGGFVEVQAKMGYEPKQRPRGQLKSWDYVESELKKMMKKNNGRFPSQKFLIKEGEGSLVVAIQNYHGGMMVAREKLGVKYDQNPYGTLQSWSWLEQQLKDIMDSNGGEFPSYQSLTKMGRHDIKHSIGKYHGGFNAVRKKFGFEPLQTPRELTRDWKWLSSELEKIIKQDKGEFPTLPRLSELDRNDLIGAMTRHYGGISKVRKRMGYEPIRNTPEQLSDFKFIEKELKKIIRDNEGDFPTQTYLTKIGRTDLTNAMGKYHNGINAVRQKMGYELAQNPKGYLDKWSNVESELKEIMEDLGRFPSKKDLEKLGKGSLGFAILKYHGGMRKVRDRLGLKQVRKENNWWQDKKAVISDVREVMQKLGYDELPPQKVLAREGYGYLNSVINRYGGFVEFRDLMRRENGLPSENERLSSLLEGYARTQDNNE